MKMIWHLIDKNRKILEKRRIFSNEVHRSVYAPLSKNLFKELNKLQFYIYVNLLIYSMLFEI